MFVCVTDCSMSSQCNTCTSNHTDCGWCVSEALCVPGTTTGPLTGSCPNYIGPKSTANCPTCSSFSTCSTCLANGPNCGWCSASSTCMAGTGIGPSTGSC